MNVKVHIVDDDETIRITLSELMQLEGIESEVYSCAEDFLDVINIQDKGCVLVDMRMPGMNGLQLYEEMERRSLFLPVVMITGHADVDTAVKALKDGMLDFIEKPFDSDKLLATVKSCLANCVDYQERSLYRDRVGELISRLTNREKQVMELLVDGLQNKEIARKLNISPRTVELHRAKVMEKLQAHTISDVVRAGMTASEANMYQ